MSWRNSLTVKEDYRDLIRLMEVRVRNVERRIEEAHVAYWTEIEALQQELELLQEQIAEAKNGN